jgi:tripartite-type tricarboxylate transporter receptor subunit TctC
VEKATTTKVLLLSIMVAALGMLFVESTNAQSPAGNFPGGKTMTMIVPWPPGGSSDTTARLVASGLEKELSTTVQVVNKGGANAQVGMTALMNSKPDGYTLGMANHPLMATHYLDPSREAPYTLKNFTLVAHQWETPTTITVRANGPYKTFKDFMEAAKANPGKITISDPGLLSNPHLSILLLEKAAGVKFASVHMAGGAPAVTALLGGHVDAGSPGVLEVMGHVKAGTLRTLAVSSERESEFFPGVPTMKSLGYNVVFTSSAGYVMPAGTPKEIVEIIAKAIKKIVESPEHKKSLNVYGTSVHYMNAEQYYAYWKQNEADFGPILKEIRATQAK